MERRDFIKNTVMVGVALGSKPDLMLSGKEQGEKSEILIPSEKLGMKESQLPDMSPSHWIWFPSERCLQNTFILFRREFNLNSKPKNARGWIFGDSRYLLNVNGNRVQWGPAPCDPRWQEIDPVDIGNLLTAGTNVIGATVLFFGQGDGTWPIGKPGFLFYLEIETENGGKEIIASDNNWMSCVAHAWQPGHYKRWFLRALQEDFDARKYPYGWEKPGFVMDEQWINSMEIKGNPDKSSIATAYKEYMSSIGSNPDAVIRQRSIPLMNEEIVPVKQLSETYTIEWKYNPYDYFDNVIPDPFISKGSAGVNGTNGTWTFNADAKYGTVLTFEFAEQMRGWPGFTIDAPEGTVVELLVHEAHQTGGPVLLNTHFNSWTRFTCRAGVNHFETFDHESLRWLQLHIHGVSGKVNVNNIYLRRRVYPWQNKPGIVTSDTTVLMLANASMNTLTNSAGETLTDGGGRERQQYSGDCGHQIHALYYTYGETKQIKRFLNTFSQGITIEGYFLDSWPGCDRLARFGQRQLGLTAWGPIIDHSIGFNFDNWHYYMYTGDTEGIAEVFPRLLRFAKYLMNMRQGNGLLPVGNIGTPIVWIDFDSYKEQHHKQCAFNLYAAAAMMYAMSPLCKAFGDSYNESVIYGFGKELLDSSVKHFWSDSYGTFINNLPWLNEEKTISMCDRSLSLAVLYDFCPSGQTEKTIKILADPPQELGLSYPANAGWRTWALSKGLRNDVILNEFRSKWINMESVKLNNTLQEKWHAKPDGVEQYCHCPVVPLYSLYMCILGIKPLEPGFKRYEIFPQFDALSDIAITANTIIGQIKFDTKKSKGQRLLTVQVPENGAAEIVLNEKENVKLERIGGDLHKGFDRYRIPNGKKIQLSLKYT